MHCHIRTSTNQIVFIKHYDYHNDGDTMEKYCFFLLIFFSNCTPNSKLNLKTNKKKYKSLFNSILKPTSLQPVLHPVREQGEKWKKICLSSEFKFRKWSEFSLS